MSKKITRVSFYLEVKAEDRKDVKNKLANIAQELNKAKFNGYGVYALINENRGSGLEVYNLGIKNIVEIPHFGHNIACRENCEDNYVGNFYRIMTTSYLWVNGKPDRSIAKGYELNKHTKVKIRNSFSTREIGTKSLKEWKDKEVKND